MNINIDFVIMCENESDCTVYTYSVSMCFKKYAVSNNTMNFNGCDSYIVIVIIMMLLLMELIVVRNVEAWFHLFSYLKRNKRPKSQ